MQPNAEQLEHKRAQQRERNRRWRNNNRDRVNQLARESQRRCVARLTPEEREQKRARHREYSRKYRAKNRKSLNAYQLKKKREYELKDPGIGTRKMKEWRARPGSKAKMRVVRVRYRENHPLRNHLTNVGQRAKRQGLEFDLTETWIKSLYEKGSALSGISFKKGNGKHSPYSASIDRIDPKGGYTQDNCRLVLYCENAFLQDMTDDEMIEIARSIIKRADS